MARTRGVVVRCIKMPNPVRDAAQILQLVEDHLTPRTRVCSFCHIDTITGLQLPLTAIAALTRPRDILLVCDGAQAPGMIDVDVKALGVDTYASSSHKWMLAPKGTGLLYIRKDVQDRVRPVFTYSGYSAYSASSGTRNVPQIVAHGVAMEFHNTIGRPRIEARCRQLSAYARQHLAEIPQLTPITPTQRELSSGIVSFSLTSGSHSEVVAALQKRDIFLKPAQGTYAYVEEADVPKENYNAIRISTHVFNDETDIDRAVEALQQVLG
ncbi:MAG: aminotransferase class V-fold PLP-dependent enzyme [Candidatus Latescibacteria bacterium]|nr:aminotransferase class V-fold PLP-dependent enzyme [Candidatus Latescibacterota bacterium]